MKNIIKNTRDIQVGKNSIWLRGAIVSPKVDNNKLFSHQQKLIKCANDGNIPAMIDLVFINQLTIWNKLKEK